MDQYQPDPGTSLFQLNLDASNSYALRSAASWGKVLGVVSLIMGVLLFIFGLVTQSAIRRMGSTRTYSEDFGSSTSMVATTGLMVYFIMGAIMIVAAIFSFNFGRKITGALNTNDAVQLNAGFAACRNFFAFWAILTIISLLFILIGLAGIMAAV